MEFLFQYSDLVREKPQRLSHPEASLILKNVYNIFSVHFKHDE